MICCFQPLLNFSIHFRKMCIQFYFIYLEFYFIFHCCMQHSMQQEQNKMYIEFHIKVNTWQFNTSHVSEVELVKPWRKMKTKIFCSSSLCKVISWVENCQVFLFLKCTLPHWCLYFCTTKRKWIAFYVIILSSMNESIQFICPLQHSSLYVDIRAILHSPGRWTMFCLQGNKTMRSSRNTNISYLKPYFVQVKGRVSFVLNIASLLLTVGFSSTKAFIRNIEVETKTLDGRYVLCDNMHAEALNGCMP